MTQYKSRSELKNEAREKLSGKYGSSMLVLPVLPVAISLVTIIPLVLIVLMPYILIMAINGADADMNSVLPPVVILAIVLLLCQILLGVLNAGTALFFLKVACGKQHAISDIFYGFRHQFKKAFAFSALTILLSNFITLPYQIFSVMYEFDPEMKWAVLALVFYIAAMIIYIPIGLALSQFYYLMLDFPAYNVRELLRLSIRIMKGQKKRLFLLQLSFLPLELLCICSCYIGYLWLSPYMMMTETLFFLDIMQPATPNTSCQAENACH